MDILVLGGTGAMGTPLVKLMAENGNHVYVTTRKQHEGYILSNGGSVTYFIGNAHDKAFIKKAVGEREYDTIVDFMVYSTDEFNNRASFLLDNTKQYIFLSSSRVYADSVDPITEDTPRLLDVSDDTEYLTTEEYALTKARQENILFLSGMNNWVVVRPYITYNTERLQLGTLEKELWVWRALERKTILMTRNTARSLTSLTYGGDVAYLISLIIDNRCQREVFQTATDECMRWEQVLNLYLEAFENELHFRPDARFVDDWEEMSGILHNRYQMKYDRFYNRVFDSSKIKSLSSDGFTFTDMRTGLTTCLKNLINTDINKRSHNWLYEGYADHITSDITSIHNIDGYKNRIKYELWRKFSPEVCRKLWQLFGRDIRQ